MFFGGKATPIETYLQIFQPKWHFFDLKTGMSNLQPTKSFVVAKKAKQKKATPIKTYF